MVGYTMMLTDGTVFLPFVHSRFPRRRSSFTLEEINHQYKMKNQILLLSILVMGMWSCADDAKEQQAVTPETSDIMSKADINDIAYAYLESEGEFKWDYVSPQVIHAALVHSNNILSIGYQPAGFQNIEEHIHEIDLSSAEWQKAKASIVSRIEQSWDQLNIDTEERFIYFDEHLPIVQISSTDLSLVEDLRDMAEVRYTEPLDYSPEEVQLRSSAGCGVQPASNVPAADYDFTHRSPQAKVSWNFLHHNVEQAWNTAKGDNITLAYIDTGGSRDQENLEGEYTEGESCCRSSQRAGTYYTGWWWWRKWDGDHDKCGHGTQMAGLGVAPKGFGYSATGIAHKANTLMIRATGDVVINSSNEKNGVKDALVMAGNRSDVKVISMSIGDVFWSNTVADGVYHAYNRGKMLVAAAGTSTWFTSWVGVTFPARMSQCVAVTGVKDGSSLRKCNTCHSGSQVDFVAVMQRSSDNDRTALTLARSGEPVAYVGGSSAATSMTAAMATVIWSTNPSQSRNQVLQKMKDASQFYPSRNSQFGWGKIDLEDAVN